MGLQLKRKPRRGYDPIKDISRDPLFLEIYEKIKDHTLVDIERCFALYNAVQYIVKNDLGGDLVECGVWKGGSCMLIAYTLLAAGQSGRKIWLYDTFMGMTEPGDMDGVEEKKEWEQGKTTGEMNRMCYASIEEVRANIEKTGYPVENMVFVKGKVETTIPHHIPSQIALLRLDTDWYESTRHELVHLYPLLAEKGILLVDDYGAWQGARKAVDEYFNDKPFVFLHRIDYTGRLIIK